MPVILRIKGFRFWFYSADLVEPPHIHVGKAGNEAKYWLRLLAWHEIADFGRLSCAKLNQY